VARILAWGEGIDPRLIHVEGRAHYDPVADNKTPESRDKNRRITIFVQPWGQLSTGSTKEEKGQQNQDNSSRQTGP